MNHLHYGDNLDVLRGFPDNLVDLIYLDPPFNSNANYNHLFRGPKGQASTAQMEAFKDTWQWDDAVSGRALDEVKASAYQDAAQMLDTMVSFLGKNALTAYLAMMAVRLVELHRVLKPTGSLYLHCDPTASHYLKVLLDAVFGPKRFLNEVTWKRTFAHNDAQRYGRIQDRVLFYSKSATRVFHSHRGEYSPEQLARYKLQDERGRFKAENLTAPHSSPTRTVEWRGTHPGASRQWRFSLDELERLYADGQILLRRDGAPRKDGLKEYLQENERPALQDIWTDIQRIGNTADERLGYPTQKPLTLLERIIAASSNPGDLVLDPFCGCGTTVHAAQRLGRRWIGIDITHIAINLIENRLSAAFPGIRYEVHGTPRDVDAAREFFNRDGPSKKQFEIWALSLIKFQSREMKGADGGVDGVEWFGPAKAHRAIASVKGGKVGQPMVDQLEGVLKKQKAEIGVFLTLQPPTKVMADYAKQAGLFMLPGTTLRAPRIQVVTIEEALAKGEGAVNLPLRHSDPFKAVPKEQAKGAVGDLFG